jgi:hypothetical protein
MRVLKVNEIRMVSGGSEQSYSLGQSVGNAARDFYDNVMISDGWIDDLAGWMFSEDGATGRNGG